MDSEKHTSREGLNITPGSDPVNVPSFTCVVYVSPTHDGQIRARVANLPGIEFVASTERDALSKIVPAFKTQVSESLSSGSTIPWIDPPAPMSSEESERLLPVHL